MQPETRTGTAGFATGLNIVLGIWLVIAGFAFAGGPQALWNDVIVGILVIIFGSSRVSLGASGRGASWVNFVLGIWLVIAPWALGYTSAASRWNDFSVGWVVLILAAISGMAASRRPAVMPPIETRTTGTTGSRKVA
jgi:hypothetical protein